MLIAIAVISFFIFAPPFVDEQQNPVITHSPYPVSQQAKVLHDSLIIGDWHADSMLWKRDIGKQHDYGHIDLPRLQQGNVALQMFTTVTKSPDGLNYTENSADAPDDITKLALGQRWPVSTWSSLMARALYQANKLHRFERDNPESLFLIKSQADLQQWQAKRKSNKRLVGGLIGTEGSHALDGKLDNVQVLYDAGFRMMSLQHFFDNKLGGSLHGTKQSGLTQFGRDVVNKIIALDIILDVSHSSEQVVKDVLEMTSRPLVVSHTGLKGHCDSPRNISDTLMQRIAANGGLIGIGYWEGAICGNSPKAIAQAIRHGISLVGANHIALGSDFDGSVTTAIDTSELAAITHELLEQGVSEAQIRKVMGGNMLTFLQNQLPAE